MRNWSQSNKVIDWMNEWIEIEEKWRTKNDKKKFVMKWIWSKNKYFIEKIIVGQRNVGVIVS